MEICTKICSKCRLDKDINEFSFNDKAKGQRRSKCKACEAEYAKTYKAQNEEKLQDKWRKASRKYSSTDMRRNKTLKKYGLTKDGYNLMYTEQDGCCKICKTNINLCVDHNHDTGKVRGLLCNKCNVGLGCFIDDIELLEKAIEYLKSNN